MEQSTMGLKRELANFRAAFERTAPAERIALYDAKVEELQASFPLDKALSVGDEAPAFTLPDAQGRAVSLFEALCDGPAVVAFYRGGWCPYCNIQLRAYQRALPAIAELGGRLIAISPQRPDGSLSTVQTNELEFDVLSDAGNGVARAFGLVYELPPELREALRSNGKALPDINGDDSLELPLPATYVIAADHRIVLASIELDYRYRLAPEAIIASLSSLHPASLGAA
jgi:peroxiredoxin